MICCRTLSFEVEAPDVGVAFVAGLAVWAVCAIAPVASNTPEAARIRNFLIEKPPVVGDLYNRTFLQKVFPLSIL
jgi:hypothetical protein